ncbi:MAG: oligopeptide transporter, OPT family [Synergistaceae bacterium]|nr:oligopeptide transporter, OPT family [Synergistaceae bacterium]
MDKNTKPFIAADRIIPEFTPFAAALGVVLALVFGAANAYLGLRIGQTVSASIPAAVISMGVIRVIFKKDSILENNMAQTIGSAGESIASAAIFVLPVLFLWGREWGTGAPSYLMITGVSLAGGILGVLFMIPLRRALITIESEELTFPEGAACAEVLKAGERGGRKAKLTFAGVGIGAVYQFISDGLAVFPSSVSTALKGLSGSGIGIDASPALMGVGFIIGPETSLFMLAGASLGWYCIMPLVYFFGSQSAGAIFPGAVPIAQMTHDDIWANYLRYIGAGAVAFGGLYSLVSSLPLIVRSFVDSMRELRTSRENGASSRTDRDLPFLFILLGAAAVFVFLIVFPYVPIGFLGALLAILFGFFFSTVSARIVGVLGSSNSPVSGMTIATLLITSLVFKMMGKTDHGSMLSVMSIGAIICTIAAISGDMSQDLKTGYIVGATPRSQQLGELIGVVFSAAAVGAILKLLDSAWGFGGREIPAIQATLMKMVTEGVMLGNLPWILVISGAAIGLSFALLRLPVLAIAIGLYLPIYLSIPVAIGGILRLPLERRLARREAEGPATEDKIENGLLYSSGLIAGEGLIGILLAIIASLGVNISISEKGTLLGPAFSCAAFAVLGYSLLKLSLFDKTSVTGVTDDEK